METCGETARLRSAGGRLVCHAFGEGASYFQGDFDEALIREKLLEAGYTEAEAAGSTYYTIRGDYEPQSEQGRTNIGLGFVNRIYIGDDSLIIAGATDEIAQALEVLSGDRSSLADDEAFNGVAAALGDPLSAVLMTSSNALRFDEEYQKPADWGALRDWEVFGVRGAMRIAHVIIL